MQTIEKIVVGMLSLIFFLPSLLLSLIFTIVASGESTMDKIGGSSKSPEILMAVGFLASMAILIISYKFVFNKCRPKDINPILYIGTVLGCLLALLLAVTMAPFFYLFIAVTAYIFWYGSRNVPTA